MIAKVGFVGLLAASVAVVSACTGAAQHPAAAPSGLQSTSVNPTTAPPASVTTPSTPVTASYDAACIQWKAGATAISAQQGKYWSQAADDLTVGETTDTNPTGYAAAVTSLKELISLPDAQQTPTQNARYHADIDALNTFCKTPGLYS